MVDAGLENPPNATPRGSPSPFAVTLLLTTACNLRCAYCYAHGGESPRETMPFAVAKRGIDFAIANARRRQHRSIEIAFHGGGEPTIAWSVLTRSLEYARTTTAENGLELHSSLSSNGVLSRKKRRWIRQNLSGVSISFDGLPSLHDTNRPKAGGSGSSDQVMQTMREFDRNRFRYAVRLTVLADQIPRLADSVEFIYRNFHPNSVQVEPVYLLGRWKGQESAETQEFIDAYRQAQRCARQYDGRVRFSGARIGSLTNHFCGATKDGFCLSPSGNVTACYEVFSEDRPWADKFFYGKPSAGPTAYEFDDVILAELRSQAVENREHCQNCFAKWTCGGDCYHKVLDTSGDGVYAGAGRCHIIRELTKDMILDRIVDSGGLFWSQSLKTISEPDCGSCDPPSAGRKTE